VRQLRKLLRRALAFQLPVADALAEERQLLGAAGEGHSAALPGSAEEIEPLEKFRLRYALRALELLGGNRAATARSLGISVNTLKAWLGAEEAGSAV
jgi:DNA-binding NtrC family response regulator